MWKEKEGKVNLEEGMKRSKMGKNESKKEREEMEKVVDEG